MSACCREARSSRKPSTGKNTIGHCVLPVRCHVAYSHSPWYAAAIFITRNHEPDATVCQGVQGEASSLAKGTPGFASPQWCNASDSEFDTLATATYFPLRLVRATFLLAGRDNGRAATCTTKMLSVCKLMPRPLQFPPALSHSTVSATPGSWVVQPFTCHISHLVSWCGT